MPVNTPIWSATTEPGNTNYRSLRFAAMTGSYAGGFTTTPAAVAIYNAEMIDGFTPKPKFIEIKRMAGIMSGFNDTAIGGISSELTVPSTPLALEQFWYMMAASWGATKVGVNCTGTGASGTIWSTPPPTTGVPVQQPATLQVGNNFNVEQADYALISEWHLKGTQEDVIKIDHKWVARANEYLGTAFNPALLSSYTTIANADTPVTSNCAIYIDDISGVFGTTLISNTVLDIDLKVQQPWTPKYPAGSPKTNAGNPTVNHWVSDFYKIDGSLEYEHDVQVSGNPAGTGAIQKFRNQKEFKMRIVINGSKAISVPGTGTITIGGIVIPAYINTLANQALVIDLVGKFKGEGPLKGKGGNDSIVMPFFSKYSRAAAVATQFSLVLESAPAAPLTLLY